MNEPNKPDQTGTAREWVDNRLYLMEDEDGHLIKMLSEEDANELADRCDRAEDNATRFAEWTTLQKEWLGGKYATMQPLDAVRARCNDDADRCDRAEAELATEEKSHLRTIRERDDMEGAINLIGAAIGLTENESTWSNLNSPPDRIIEKVGEMQSEANALRATIEALRAGPEILDRPDAIGEWWFWLDVPALPPRWHWMFVHKPAEVVAGRYARVLPPPPIIDEEVKP